MASGSGQGGSADRECDDERGSRTVTAGPSTHNDRDSLPRWIHVPSTHLEVLVEERPLGNITVIRQRLLNPGEEPPRGVSAARWIPIGEFSIEVYFDDFEILEYRREEPIPHFLNFFQAEWCKTGWVYGVAMPRLPRLQRSRDDSGSEQPTTSPHN